MPATNTHQKAAFENQKALAYLQARVDDFPQWCVVVAFYAAVQIVEAVFAQDGIHSEEHTDRNHRLKSTNRYRHIWKHYRELWNDSLIARYLTGDGHEYGDFSAYMRPSAVVSTHINHNLAQIIRSARTLLNDDTFLAAPTATEPPSRQ
jgi:hypothetical protein